MSDTPLNMLTIQIPASALELAKDSAAVAAHMAEMAFRADDHNLHGMRSAFAELAMAFADDSQKFLAERPETEPTQKTTGPV